MSAKRIAIYGAGAIGTITGAYLSKAYGKENVTLVDAWQENVDALNEKGAHIIGATDLTVPVSAVKPDELSGQYDVILLHTKQGFNDTVIPAIKKILAPDGTLISLQNGVPERNILKVLDAKNVIAGSVEFGGTGHGPGVSELTTEFESFKKSAFQVGEVDGQITDRIEMIQEILTNIGGTAISDNLMGTKWTKLLINASFSGLSAAANTTYGGVLASDVGIKAALYIMNEALNAGYADLVTFAPMNGVDFAESFSLKGPAFTQKQIDYLRQIMAPWSNLQASMLQDLLRHHKTEINEINGLIVDTAKEHNVSTPYNDLIVKIVTEAQNTDTLPKFDETMAQFEQLLAGESMTS